MTGSGVKRLREKMLLSRAQLADLFAVDPATVARWEALGDHDLPPYGITARRIFDRLRDDMRRARVGVAMREYGWAAAWAILFSNGGAR